MSQHRAVNALDRRKRRQDYAAFAGLLATPGNLATGVQLPAAGELYVGTSSVLAATTVLVEAGTRELGSPAAAANSRHHVGRLERGVTVVKAAAAPGTVRLYLRDPAGAVQLIAQG